MMERKGILIKTVLTILIFLVCLGLLLVIGNKLYGNYTEGQEDESAAVLRDKIEDKIKELNDGEITELNSEGVGNKGSRWYIGAWAESYKYAPDKCTSYKSCICVCKSSKKDPYYNIGKFYNLEQFSNDCQFRSFCVSEDFDFDDIELHVIRVNEGEERPSNELLDQFLKNTDTRVSGVNPFYEEGDYYNREGVEDSETDKNEFISSRLPISEENFFNLKIYKRGKNLRILKIKNVPYTYGRGF